MKKILLSAAVLISITAYAQKIRIGFTGGTSIANYQIKAGGETESTRFVAGFTAGIIADIPGDIPQYKHFSFQPAINFVQKGTRNEQSFGGVTEKIKINVYCLEMPFDFLYNSRGKTANIFIGGGPSLAVALSGKVKYDDGTIKTSEDLKFGNGDEDYMRPVDFTANIIAGFSLNNGLMFSVNYNAGLTNLIPQGTDDVKFRSSYFGIKLGYFLK